MKVFLSYSHIDEPWRNVVVAYLNNLQSQGVITSWHERSISLNKAWLSEIDPYLQTAQLILLLVSPDFVSSDYCYSIEMKYALQRYKTRQARIIPIMVRPVDWEDTPFFKFPALPTAAKPITTWPNQQEAFLDLAQGIEAAARELDLNNPFSAFPDTTSADLDTLPIWHVPYQRNWFFTGRERILTYLYTMPVKDKAAASTLPQVISGLDGSGRTQVALEYAYRYRDNYTAVFWVHADSCELLASDFARIAALLNLPEKDKQNQDLVVDAVRRWLQTSPGWLLIFDNAADITMVRDFLPTGGRGHILMTTRTAVAPALALNVEIQKMGPADEALLLLRRAKIIPADAPLGTASRADRLKVEEISVALHGLPFALDLAGAYIGEVQCSLTSYLDLYKLERVRILKQRAKPVPDYLEAAATALAISLGRVDPCAAELLCFCAFLSADGIPEEVLTAGASKFGTTLQAIVTDWFELNKTIRELRRYSLVQRNRDDAMLTLHPLLQTVLRERMDGEIQHEWAKRAVQAVEQVLPDVEPTTWQHCQRYLPSMQSCVTLIEQWQMEFPEAASLLEQAGNYLQLRVQYAQAELLLLQALTIREKLLGAEHPDVVTFLNNLALFYEKQGKYTQAESYFQRVLTIREKALEPDTLDVAQCLNNLALIYRDQGKYTEAELFFQRALKIRNQRLGPDHPEVATVLSNLGTLYRMLGKDMRAVPLFQRSLAIRERTLGSDHADVARSCSELAGLYRTQGKYSLAEPLYQRALAINDRVLEPGHPDLATTLNNLALLYHEAGKYSLAGPFYLQALASYEQSLGLEHPYVASCLGNLALLYNDQGLYEQVEQLYQRSLAIREKVLGPEHFHVAVSLNNLAMFYTARGKYAKAKVLFEKALAIGEQTLGPHHLDLAQFLENYATLLQKTRETAKAAQVKARVEAIRAKHVQKK